MATPHPRGRRSFACVIFLFVTKGKFHIPRNSPQKEKMTHVSQPTPRRTRVKEPLRTGVGVGVGKEQPTHRPRRAAGSQQRLEVSPDLAGLEGGAGVKLECSDV